MKKHFFATLLGIYTICSTSLLSATASNQEELRAWYQYAYTHPSDINQHVPLLSQLAMECSSVTEIGLRSMVSTWGILYGLANNSTTQRSYLGIDLEMPPQTILSSARKIAQKNEISFQFLQSNDMDIEIDQVDMLFIDSLHTYCHLTYELEKFSSSVNKYICMHDTSAPWGDSDDTDYQGDYSEYPETIDRTKKGLWLAVEDFLQKHPEWMLLERRFNNHGFTLLKRVCVTD